MDSKAAMESRQPAESESTAGSKRMQDFERGCALILAQLYEWFPVPSHIRIVNLEPSADGEVQRTHCATFEFLSKEGYLRYETATGPRARGLVWNNDFRDVVLTAKGLAVLDAVPPVLKHEAQRSP